MPTRLWSVVFDANDPAALAHFWADALGWRLKEHERWWSVSAGGGFLPRIDFVSVPEPKTSKNRIHFDLASESVEHQRAIVERLVHLGAVRIDIGQPIDAKHVVLADRDANEFCVVPPTEFWNLFPNTGPIAAIAIDADMPTLGRFWCGAVGWPVVYEEGPYLALRAPSGSGPLLTFGPRLQHPEPRFVVEPKSGKNRVHLDVAPFPGDDQVAEVERLIALGARRIDIGQGEVPWVVMADPEDNEFCLLSPR